MIIISLLIKIHQGDNFLVNCKLVGRVADQILNLHRIVVQPGVRVDYFRSGDRQDRRSGH